LSFSFFGIKLKKIFLQSSQKANITAEFPADKYGTNSNQKTDNRYLNVSKISTERHCSKADSSIGTELMTSMEFVGDKDQDKYDPETQENILD
jgi:hypothetical protein